MMIKGFETPQEVDKLLPALSSIDENEKKERELNDLCKGFEDVLSNPRIAQICTDKDKPLLIAECVPGKPGYPNDKEPFCLYLGYLDKQDPLCFFAIFKNHENESGFGKRHSLGLTIIRLDVNRGNIKELQKKFEIPAYEDLYEKVNQAILLKYKDKITQATGDQIKDTLSA